MTNYTFLISFQSSGQEVMAVQTELHHYYPIPTDG